jgi:hypothetical protein
MNNTSKSTEPIKLKATKRLFLKLGSCSRTMGFILNREFGNLSEPHERALDPLAGGIIQQGYQCGMLWGTSLAVGAESYKRSFDKHKATALAIKATQNIMKSFSVRTQTMDCYDITQTDWNKKSSIAKYMITGKVFNCFKLLEKWAPEAIQSAREGLSADHEELPEKCKSCASEVVRKMGGSEEETAMVAGYAGGIGLSGNACGALGAAIWMKTLEQCKAEPGKSFYTNPKAREVLEDFYQKTDYEILCSKITGKKFQSVEDHTEFIQNGGCKELIDELANK